tara:strand:- start:1549 stop:2601 length:1053 start_codon:yes stop_codon:yes gene_type:complete
MTIAYSDKYNAWTTRYSFEPTCYACTDNYFVSAKADVWRHDVNSLYCNFYGDANQAGLTVSSNQDPSSIKSFNAVSLETNGKGWSANVYTNEEYSGSEKQEGSISSFKNKEGFKYASMPKSTLNSTSNVTPISPFPSPSLPPLSEESERFDWLVGHSEIMGLYSVGVEGLGTVYSQLLNYVDPSNYSWTSELIGGVYYYKITVPCSTPISNVSVPFSDQTTMLSVDSSGVTSTVPLLIRDNPSVNPITGRNFLPVYAPVSMFSDLGQLSFPNVGLFSQAFMNLFGEVDGESNWVNYNHYAASPSQINGDSMRGPYAKVELRTPTSDPFELHAVNVDYSFSRLDSRLTQNA